VEEKSAKFGFTALRLACGNNQLNIAQVLLDNGADVNTADGTGWTPLMAAARKGREDVCKFLISHKADIRAKSTADSDCMNKDSTVLQFAEQMNRDNIARLLQAALNASPPPPDQLSDLKSALPFADTPTASPSTDVLTFLICSDYVIRTVKFEHLSGPAQSSARASQARGYSSRGKVGVYIWMRQGVLQNQVNRDVCDAASLKWCLVSELLIKKHIDWCRNRRDAKERMQRRSDTDLV